LILAIRSAARDRRNPAAELTGAVIQPETLWACMTCGACIAECPLLIEHIDVVVDLRRSLVVQGKLEHNLQNTLTSAASFGNTESQPAKNRSLWAGKLKTPIKDARQEAVEYLWLTGDQLAYTAELEPIAVKTAAAFPGSRIELRHPVRRRTK
jgi:Fe-S oxidoreductase